MVPFLSGSQCCVLGSHHCPRHMIHPQRKISHHFHPCSSPGAAWMEQLLHIFSKQQCILRHSCHARGQHFASMFKLLHPCMTFTQHLPHPPAYLLSVYAHLGSAPLNACVNLMLFRFDRMVGLAAGDSFSDVASPYSSVGYAMPLVWRGCYLLHSS